MCIVENNKLNISSTRLFLHHCIFFNKRKYISIICDVLGVPHGDDMAYFFGGLISGPLSEEEKKLKNIALDILYSYAHEG